MLLLARNATRAVATYSSYVEGWACWRGAALRVSLWTKTVDPLRLCGVGGRSRTLPARAGGPGGGDRAIIVDDVDEGGVCVGAGAAISSMSASGLCTNLHEVPYSQRPAANCKQNPFSRQTSYTCCSNRRRGGPGDRERDRPRPLRSRERERSRPPPEDGGGGRHLPPPRPRLTRPRKSGRVVTRCDCRIYAQA